MNIYSSGMLKTYMECPSKYNLIYNEHIQIPSDNNYSEIGNKIHSLINYYYNGFDIKKLTKFDNSEESLIIKNLWENFLEIKPDKLLKSEYVFNIKISDKTLLTGRIDGIYKSKENIVIADWKTGLEISDIKKDTQTMVYLYSIYTLLNEYEEIKKYENLSMVYYFLKNKTKKQIDLSEQYFEEIKEFIISLTNIINADTTYLKEIKAKCGICSYKNLCHHAYG